MDAPFGLGERGLALWEALAQAPATPAGVLALEACRTADRLDELDSIIQGKGVLNLMQFRVLNAHTNDDESRNIHVEVSFQNVLSEARQQQMALKQMLSALGLEVGAPAGDDGKVSPLAQVLALVRDAKPAGGAAV